MALYAIGDLHLSMDGQKPMDRFGEIWESHPQKLKGFEKVTQDDVTVLCGDLSWGMSMEGAKADFAFIDRLPGKKILLKGNHDYWWSTETKARRFFEENGFESLDILHNRALFYENVALCGTRGWFYEEERGTEHDRKMMLREIGRMETSLKAAGDREKIVFLHYPPLFENYRCEEMLSLFRSYEVKQCYYGHLHGRARLHAFQGWDGPTRFRLVSADQLLFEPLKIL